MLRAPNATASTADFADIWTEAVTRFKDKTGHDLLNPSIAHYFECTTSEEVKSVLAAQVAAFATFRGKDTAGARIQDKLGKFLDVVWKFSTAAGDIAGEAIPSTRIIFAAFGVMLKAAKGVSEIYDGLDVLFSELALSLERINTYLHAPPAEITLEFRGIIVRILASLLDVISLSTKYVLTVVPEHRIERNIKKFTNRLKVYGLALIGDSEVQDMVESLKTLMEGEAQQRGAEMFVKISLMKNKVDAWLDDHDIEVWLGHPIDPLIRHRRLSAIRDGSVATGSWIISHQAFGDWMANTCGAFWLKGKAGSGKSILTSAIISHLDQLDCLLVYYYFDFRLPEDATGRKLLISIISKLASQHPECLSRVKSFRSREHLERSTPDVDQLLACLHGMPIIPFDLFVIIDALDECTYVERAKDSGICYILENIMSWQDVRIRMLISSRPEDDIERCFHRLSRGPSNRYTVHLHDAEEQKRDLASYISSRLRLAKHYDSWSTSLRAYAENILIQRADGMFLWVALHLHTLLEAPSNEVAAILDALPSEIHDAFNRIFAVAPKSAAHAFRCIAFAERQLTPVEVAEVLAVDWNKPTPLLLTDSRITSDAAVSSILRMCSSLVEIVHSGISSGSQAVQFVHMSAREYLLSGNLPHNLQHFRLDERNAHVTLACLCLITLLYDEPDSSVSGTTGVGRPVNYPSPFRAYATKYWPTHVRACGAEEDPAVGELLQQFLKNDSPPFQRWIKSVRYWQPRQPMYHRSPGSATFETSFALRSTFTWLQWQSADRFASRETTPLYTAAYFGLSTYVRTALRGEIILSNETGVLGSPLHAAASQGRIEILQLLLSDTASGPRADVNDRNEHGWSALHIASYYGQDDCVCYLLGLGAAVNATTKEQLMPVHCAAARGRSDVVRVLIEHGADLNACSNHVSALHLASYFQSYEMVRLLVELGADLNVSAWGGVTPLHLAALKGFYDIVRLFFEIGADINARDPENLTPLHEATQAETVQLLIDHGANINARDSRGATPLHRAAYCDLFDVAKILLEHGADVNARDAQQLTPLHVACAAWNKSSSIVRLLIQYGGDIDDPDSESVRFGVNYRF